MGDTKLDEAANLEFFVDYACLTGDCPHFAMKDCLTVAFKAGALYERERSKGLVEALEFYARHHHHLNTTAPNFARQALQPQKKDE